MIGALLVWLVLAIMVGMYASNKGHSGFGMFLVAILLSPLIGFLIELIRRPDIHVTEAAALSTGEVKKCPYCAELVKREAIVCKHCGRDLPTASVTAHPVHIESDAEKICPDCREYVNVEALACTRCGRDLPDEIFPGLMADKARIESEPQYKEAFRL